MYLDYQRRKHFIDPSIQKAIKWEIKQKQKQKTELQNKFYQSAPGISPDRLGLILCSQP